MTRNVNRRPPTWAIIGAVMLLVTAAYAATQKGMPEGGAWRIVTLYLHTAVGTTESGTLSTDGTTLDCSLALAGTDVTADDDLIAGDDVDVGDDILLTDDITPDSDGVSDLGSSTKAFLNVYADGIKTTLDTSLSIHALGDGSGDTADILFKTAANTTQWTIDQDGDLTAASGNNILVTDNSSAIGASGAELATLWVQAIDDGDGTVDVAAALTADSLTVDANGDVGISGTGALKTPNIEASDGTSAITIADSTVATVLKAASVSMDHASGVFAADSVFADKYEDQAGTGSPSFTHGLTIAASQVLAAGTDGTVTIGASGTEIGTIWVQTVDDSDGTVDVAAACTVSGGNLTVTGDVLPEADGTRALGASGTEYGTVWASIVDDGDGTVQVAAALDVVGAVTGSSSISLDVGGTGSATEGCVGIAGVAGNGTVSLCADNASGQWDGLQIRGPTDPSAPGAVDMMSLTTTTVTLNVGATVSDNKDILFAVDGTSSLGASGTEAQAVWTQSIDDGDGTVGVDAALTVGGNATITGDVLPEADGTRDLGSITARMAQIHTDSVFVSPITSIYGADYTVTATETFVQATGALAETDVVLPNATTVEGRLICVMVADTTTNNVLVKVATSGKIGNSAAPDGANGTAGATGVTAGANGSCGCWISNGTNYDLALASGSWAAP